MELIDLFCAEDKQRDKITLSSHCPQTVCASSVMTQHHHMLSVQCKTAVLETEAGKPQTWSLS